jgi:hypothetical protein
VSIDIERLLAAAADDSEQPLRTSVEHIVARGRRSVRNRRIAAVTTSVLTTAVVVGSVAAWPTHQAEPGPAGTTPTANISIETRSGKVIQPPPPVSPLSDAVILQRCLPLDREWNESMADRGASPLDKAGPLGSRWKLALKTGTGDTFFAILLSPDRTVAATCTLFGPSMYTSESSYGRTPLTETRTGPVRRPADQFQGPASLHRVLADGPGNTLREALVGTDGIFSFGAARTGPGLTRVQARGYDADGNRVMEHEVTVAPR